MPPKGQQYGPANPQGVDNDADSVQRVGPSDESLRALRWHQTGVLAERYLDVLVADTGNTLLLLLQAPIIATCIILVWRDVAQPTDTMYYVMALTAVWFGAINACRELVRERPIYLRERMVGQDPTAYVLSKIVVLAALGFVQCLTLVFLVHHYVPLGGAPLLHFFVLYGASLAGAALGLCLSALVSTSERAVAAVPLLLLPQILFSNVVLSHEHASRLIRILEDCTITAWAYDGLKQVTKVEPSYGHVAQSLAVLLGMALVLILVPVSVLNLARSRS